MCRITGRACSVLRRKKFLYFLHFYKLLRIYQKLNDNFTTVYNCDENIKLKGYKIKGTAANLFCGNAAVPLLSDNKNFFAVY